MLIYKLLKSTMTLYSLRRINYDSKTWWC